jgi:hypothetical protein
MTRIKYSTWVHFVDLCDLPIRPELRETYDAAGEYQAECLAAMWHYASANVRATNNPLGLSTAGSFFGFATFASNVDAVQEWLQRESYRLYDPATGTTTSKLTAGILAHDSQPDSEPEPLPERVTQPTQYDLRNWFCSNRLLKYDDGVFELWREIHIPYNLFPELVRITEDERGRIHHFESGLKIMSTPDSTGVMYFDKDSV